MEPLTIELNGRQHLALLYRIIRAIEKDRVTLLLEKPQNTDVPYGIIHPCDAGHLATDILDAILEPIDPPSPERCLFEAASNREGSQLLELLSGSPHPNQSCAVCYNPLEGRSITDMNGEEWPIHRGECAAYVGLPDDGFEPRAYPNPHGQDGE